MSLPFTRDAFLDVFAAYNEWLWPFALMLWLATLYAVVLVVRAKDVRPWFLPGLLALHWAWAGLAYHAAFFSTINPAAWLFSAFFVLEAGLLAWHGVVHRRLRFSTGRSVRHMVAGAFVTYALAYPLLNLAQGLTFPRVPTFGVPCPTTILTVGLLLAAKTPSWSVAIIPVLWSMIGGSAALLLSVRADFVLFIAAAVLVTSIPVQRRQHVRQAAPAAN